MSTPLRLTLRPLLRPVALALLVGALPLRTPIRRQRCARRWPMSRAEDWAGRDAAAEGPIAQDIVRMEPPARGRRHADATTRISLPAVPTGRAWRCCARKGEEAVARSTDPDRVLAWFAQGQPETVEGSFALIRAYAALGRTEDAAGRGRRAWIALSFTTEQEADDPCGLSVRRWPRCTNGGWTGCCGKARRSRRGGCCPGSSDGWRSAGRGADGAARRCAGRRRASSRPCRPRSPRTPDWPTSGSSGACARTATRMRRH